jgi:hypothetical protein
MDADQQARHFVYRHSKSGRMANFLRWWYGKVKGRKLTPEERENIYTKI